MEEDTQKQHKKQYDWLKGYQFVKGVSGNPGGRPKGKSLKTFAREYLESLPDDEKVEFLKTLEAETIWKMAEGNPENKNEVSGEFSINLEVDEVGKITNAIRNITTGDNRGSDTEGK